MDVLGARPVDVTMATHFLYPPDLACLGLTPNSSLFCDLANCVLA